MKETKELFNLNIDKPAKDQLIDAAKWARFMAITGMIGIILLSAVYITGVAFFPDRFLSDEPEYYDAVKKSGYLLGRIIGFLLFALIGLFPFLSLFKFANKARKAVVDDDPVQLQDSFKNLKKYFRFLGVITIIFMVMLLLVFSLMGFGLLVKN